MAGGGYGVWSQSANRSGAAGGAALKASARAKLVAGQPLTPEEAATIIF